MDARRSLLLSDRQRLLATGVVILAVVMVLVTGRTWSAFSGTAVNAGNTASAGTVSLTDNDAGNALFSLSNLVPGDTDTGCVQVNYTGSLPALVRLYQTTTGSGLASYFDLTITRGTLSSGTFDDCTNFTADATDYLGFGGGVVYNGTLAGLGTDWTGGLVDDNNTQTRSATTTFTWEARNTSSYSQIILSDGPISYWRLDETAGTSAVPSAGAVTGTYAGGVTP